MFVRLARGMIKMVAIALASIRQGVFEAIRALLVNNKPTYTYNSATQTYNIYAEYPRSNPSFPCIVINKASIEDERLTMDALTGDESIEVQLDFYAKELHGKKAIDAGVDGAMNTIIGNIATFQSSNGIVPQSDFWTDNGSSTFEENNQVVNTASSLMRFRLV
jgi:hypothetical protein